MRFAPMFHAPVFVLLATSCGADAAPSAPTVNIETQAGGATMQGVSGTAGQGAQGSAGPLTGTAGSMGTAGAGGTLSTGEPVGGGGAMAVAGSAPMGGSATGTAGSSTAGESGAGGQGGSTVGMGGMPNGGSASVPSWECEAPESTACNCVEDVGEDVPVTRVDESAPPGEGGVISPGLYVLTEIFTYSGSQIPSNLTFRGTAVISDGIMAIVGNTSGVGAYRTTHAITTSENRLSYDQLCTSLTVGGPAPVDYTATETELRLYSPDLGSTYTKR